MRAIVLLVVLATSPAWAIEISNFKSGLACTNTRLSKDAKAGWICQPTEDILVTDQGDCVYDGQSKFCTWMGFEFDYKGATEGTKLQCASTMSEPVDSGNPRALVGKDLRSEEFEIPLAAGSGHFFNPQYYIFNVRTKASKDASINQHTVCRTEGSKAFEYKFNIKFPLVD